MISSIVKRFLKKRALQKGGVALKELPKGVYLYYSKTYPKHAKVIKSDPFVGLYLLQSAPSEYVYTLRDLDKDALIRPMASIGDKEALETRLLVGQKEAMSATLKFRKRLKKMALSAIFAIKC